MAIKECMDLVRADDRVRAKKTRANRENDPERKARWLAYKREWYRKNKINKGGGPPRQRRVSPNVTVSAFEVLEVMQDGKCAICGLDEMHPDTHSKMNRRLSIDHRHNCCPSGGGCVLCIRGLLCGRCNRGIGIFKDDPELMRKAADYLYNGGTGDYQAYTNR